MENLIEYASRYKGSIDRQKLAENDTEKYENIIKALMWSGSVEAMDFDKTELYIHCITLISLGRGVGKVIEDNDEFRQLYCEETGMDILSSATKNDATDGKETVLSRKENPMICSKCGNEIAADAAFCPNCGTKVIAEGAVSGTDTKTAKTPLSFTDVKITGKRAGEVSLWYAIVAVIVFFLADIMSDDADSVMPSLFLWGVCIFIIVCARMLLPKMVSYIENDKKFKTNRESRFNAVQKSIDINTVIGVRLRKVKLFFSSRHAFSVPGEYFVFAFDTKYKDTNRYLWFQKEDEFRNFETLVKKVFEENGIDIPFDENLTLIKAKEFYAQETREKLPFDFSEFLRKKNKTIAIAVGIFLAFIFIVNISESDYSNGYSSTPSVSTAKGKNSIDKALDKMESALRRIDELQNKSDDDEFAYGKFMSEYSKAMKELEDAQRMVEGIDESDVTPEQWERIFELSTGLYRFKNLE